MKILLSVALMLGAAATTVLAQPEGDLQKGIALYRQGSYDQAIKVFEGLSKSKNVKDEPTLLNYLGLAYMEKKELKKARKTFERAAAIAPQNAAVRTNLAFALLRSNKPEDALVVADQAVALDAQMYIAYFVRGTASLWTKKYDEAIADADRTIALKEDFAPAYTLKADTYSVMFGNRVGAGADARDNAAFLGKAVEALEACAKKCAPDATLDAQREKLDAFQAFYRYFNRDKSDVTALTSSDDTITAPIEIKTKPRANYTDEARQAGISGRIVLAVLFDASGKVTQVLVVKPLGFGLDQEAIKAARGIRFSPLMRNGKAVSVVKTVEYSFSIGGR